MEENLTGGSSNKMHELKSIGIAGFRRLHDIKIEMRPLMVMIGANGVGKSSLLDAITLLSASATGAMNRTLSDMGGIADVVTRIPSEGAAVAKRGRPEGVELSAAMNVPGYHPLEYTLCVKPIGQTYSISHESLSQDRGQPEPFRHIEARDRYVRYYDDAKRNLVAPDWEHNPFESSLSQVPKMFRQPEELRRILSSVTHYHVLDVSRRAPVKLPQAVKPADLPGPDGEDLLPLLYTLRESSKDRYEAIQDTLKTAFPGFEWLSLPPAAAGMLSLAWKEKHFKDPLFMHQLSEGTLRFLWLIALLQSPGLSTITMIDEPEVSLHPELLSLLADLMREASERTQVIVATHSDRLVRFLDPKEVVVMDTTENGFATATWADAMDLDEWLKEYSLDEVWRMGRMGGRS